MARDPRFDPLFEPLRIGPVTAPNRFYQVPHCTGMGYLRPQMLAEMRGVKAEGGWGVVCTEYCSIHESSDETPYPCASLRDDDDVSNLRLMTEKVHAHGALAGVELWYGGHGSANLYSRATSLDVASLPNDATLGVPAQSQAMDRSDIRAFRKMYREAAKRALQADFDIVYVYANHYYLLHNFLNPDFNRRSDEYGGPAANRVRLLREVIDDVAAIVAGRSALAVRYSIPRDYENDPKGLLECFSLIAELPDLWDITVDDYGYEMGSSRFVREASNQEAMRKIRSMTSRPVVGVGRFTSPDTMLAQIAGGIQDFIGAARPSIADPFLPQKISQGRLEDIRECIGCNVCYAHDSLAVPIRCTQNPTMGEEWRRGWHPEKVTPSHADETVLIVGAGPAGLEAACTLGRRGYRVTLAEAETELGGRINRESSLPGLAEYARVRDWRIEQLARMPNVDIYPDNRLDTDAVLRLDSQHVILATGARWRSDGVGRWRRQAFAGCEQDAVIGVEQLLDGFNPGGHVVIYDDDHYYLGSALALYLRAQGAGVTMVSPQDSLGGWGKFTTEHRPAMRALIEAGVQVVTARGLVEFADGRAEFECVYGGARTSIAADYLLPISARVSNDELWRELDARRDEFGTAGGLSLQRIGDCRAPGIIAQAVFAGHLAARDLGQASIGPKRDRVVLS
ncbi:MAG: FAD-dependent oxidoreductase [Gammaproteobacteria bacterium]|nr:FAD-dependent oxidoreductase [Gammaproteobacteria bacterium]MDH3447508.1 FAD-dependent oxidoreductase [Gammaproteobacteria bacterium]